VGISVGSLGTRPIPVSASGRSGLGSLYALR